MLDPGQFIMKVILLQSVTKLGRNLQRKKLNSSLSEKSKKEIEMKAVNFSLFRITTGRNERETLHTFTSSVSLLMDDVRQPTISDYCLGIQTTNRRTKKQ